MFNEVDLSVEHVLMFVIVAFLLYHLIGGCSCGMLSRDGFSVGGPFYCGWTGGLFGVKAEMGCKKFTGPASDVYARKYFDCHKFKDIGNPCNKFEGKKDATFDEDCFMGSRAIKCTPGPEPEPAYDCTMEVDKCSNAWPSGEQRYACNAYVNNNGNQCGYDSLNEECIDTKISCPKPAPAPGPTPGPAPAPTPGVFCNPKSRIPQFCPGNIPCPQCGDEACLCPKN